MTTRCCWPATAVPGTQFLLLSSVGKTQGGTHRHLLLLGVFTGPILSSSSRISAGLRSATTLGVNVVGRRPGLWLCEKVDDRELRAGSEDILVFYNTGENLEHSWDSAIQDSAPHKSEQRREDCKKKQQDKCSHSVTSFGSKRMSKTWH